MGIAIPLHPDWEDEPVHGDFERMYRNGVPQDRYVCYIIGRSKGKRYCRTIETIGREFEVTNVQNEAERIRTIVTMKGPAVCVPLKDESGDMPSEKDMPPLP